MYGGNTLGIAQVSALGSSEASAPKGFKCISIMGDSNEGRATVRSRGGVLSKGGEVPLYLIPLMSTGHKVAIKALFLVVQNLSTTQISACANKRACVVGRVWPTKLLY